LATVQKYVGLLRGVNVGGRNKVSMAELRALFESLGYGEVRTFIQSGNVIFAADGPVTAKAIESAIAARFNIAVAVVLRTPGELERIVRDNPFTRADPSNLHVGFMTQRPSADVVAALDHERFRPELFAVKGAELYFWLPDGMARTKLPSYLDRQLRTPTTIRNWRTLNKLVELAHGS
jgi:uncharacterized protein (DUF1697 family)